MSYFELNKLSVIITGDCNLNCGYCYWLKNKSKINKTIIVDMFKKIKNTKGKQKRIVLTGGDPLLERKQTQNLVDNTKKYSGPHKIKLILNTNGLLLNKYSVKELKNFDEISISLDGSLNTMKNTRKTKTRDYDKIIHNINSLLKTKNLKKKVIINKVITADTVNELYPDLIEISKLDVSIRFSIEMGNVSWREKEFKIYEAEMKKIYNHISSDKKFRKNLKFLFNIPINFCPYSNLTIDTNGDIYNCEILASIKKRKLGNIADGFERFACNYSLSREKCLNETCLTCKQICKHQKFVYKKDQNNYWFNKAKRLRTYALNRLILSKNIMLPDKIFLKNEILTKYQLTKILNFIVAINKITPKIMIYTKSDTQMSIIKKELKNYKNFLKLIQLKKYQKIGEGLIFNSKTEEIYLKNQKTTKFVGYFNEEEINPFDIIQ